MYLYLYWLVSALCGLGNASVGYFRCAKRVCKALAIPLSLMLNPVTYRDRLNRCSIHDDTLGLASPLSSILQVDEWEARVAKAMYWVHYLHGFCSTRARRLRTRSEVCLWPQCLVSLLKQLVCNVPESMSCHLRIRA